jgi:hypothetical protein
LDFNVKLHRNFALGFYLNGNLLGSQPGIAVYSNGSMVTGKFNRDFIHLDLSTAYHFTGMVDGLWVGLRTGIGYVSETFSSPIGASGYIPNPNVGFELAPAMGYDFMITEKYSIGADLSYMMTLLETPYSGFLGMAAFKMHY